MALPASGLITMDMVNVELGFAAGTPISLNDAAVRALFGKPSGAISLSDGYGKSNRVYATWNPSDKGSQIVLSNGNLTTTGAAQYNFGIARSTIAKSTGLWYWEYICTGTMAIASPYVGIAYATADFENRLGMDAGGFGYWQNGDVRNAGGLLASGAGAFNAGDVIGFAVNCSASTFSIYKNNAAQYLNISYAGGSIYAASGAEGGGYATANFGATPLTYTPPIGYNPGLYT